MKGKKNRKEDDFIDDKTLSDLDECFRAEDFIEEEINDDIVEKEIIEAYSQTVSPHIRRARKKPFII